MMPIKDTTAWAEAVFSASPLPDERLVARLVQYAGAQAVEPTASTSAACRGDRAAREGAYRFLENERVKPDDIAEGMYQSTAELCRDLELVLIIQDTSDVAVRSWALAEELKELGCPTGFLVHSALAVNGRSRRALGLLHQDRWLRPRSRPSKAKRDNRPYEEKESYKWERAARAVDSRLYHKSNCVQVGDRESDVTEYIEFLIENDWRFVIRACSDRRVEGEGGHLWAAMKDAPVLGVRRVNVQQRGAVEGGVAEQTRPARPGRVAHVEIRAGQVVLNPYKRRAKDSAKLSVNAVWVVEPRPPPGQKPLEWMLLASEPVSTLEQAVQVIEIYEARWMIEEFHKCWKTGCRLEERPLQSIDAVERMMVITAAIGVRIMQLHWLANLGDRSLPCDQVLDRDQWECLWAFAEPGRALPTAPPSAEWGLKAIARLGGWYDTKRNGRIGWQTIWRGYRLLDERAEGWRAARDFGRRRR